MAILVSAALLNVISALGSDWTNGKGVVLPLKNRLTNKLTRLGTKGPIVPMHGNLTFWAEFFVTIGLGTPPQNMLVDIDTGALSSHLPSSVSGPLFSEIWPSLHFTGRLLG